MLPFIVAAVALAGSLTGGASGFSKVSGLVGLEFMRRRGHRRGEGPLSPKYEDDLILIKEDSPSSLGSFISKLAASRPELLNHFQGKFLDLTASEGEQLFAMAVPIKAILVRQEAVQGQLEEARLLLLQDEVPAELEMVVRELVQERKNLDEELTNAVLPISLFLKSIPSTRVKG